MLKVIGVHSNVSGDAALTDGHAWISLHFDNGRSTTVGLWGTHDPAFALKHLVPDPIGLMEGSAETFDVEFGKEQNEYAKANRYYALARSQAQFATKVLGTYTGWRFTNTCATWATRVVKELTGEELDSSELMGSTNTPRALGNAILKLEAKQPTSLNHPRLVRGNPIVGAMFAAA